MIYLYLYYIVKFIKSTSMNSSTEDLIDYSSIESVFNGISPLIYDLNYTDYVPILKINPTNKFVFEERIFFIPNCSYIQIHFDFSHIPSTNSFFTYGSDWQVTIYLY